LSVRVALILYAAAALNIAAQNIDKADQDYWNGKYAGPASEFSHQPSRLLVDAVRGRSTGAAIDLGMGEGRNAVWLAQQGWRVTGVDLSDVAIAQAKKRAAEARVRIDAVVDDLDHYDFGRARWDLITVFYMHAWYQGTRPHVIERIRDALKPGGLLVMEGFAGEREFMFHANELLRDFGDLRAIRYEDTNDEADWAPGRHSHIIRFVAEKPN